MSQPTPRMPKIKDILAQRNAICEACPIVVDCEAQLESELNVEELSAQAVLEESQSYFAECRRTADLRAMKMISYRGL